MCPPTITGGVNCANAGVSEERQAEEGTPADEEEREEQASREGPPRRLRDKLCMNSKWLIAAGASAFTLSLAAVSMSIAREIASDDRLAKAIVDYALTVLRSSNVSVVD